MKKRKSPKPLFNDTKFVKSLFSSRKDLQATKARKPSSSASEEFASINTLAIKGGTAATFLSFTILLPSLDPTFNSLNASAEVAAYKSLRVGQVINMLWLKSLAPI